ncbi:MAG: 30S ribosomal protein S9 [Candidatus Woesearchaeota archaeon]|nr:30S ribosomal protein S9 [Candidatus Woesearchaeota archaeon]
MSAKAVKEKGVHVSGKRKTAIARATLRPGKGIIKINNIFLERYGNHIARMKIMEPLLIAGDIAKNVDIDVKVNGGGVMSGAEAVRLAIGRALAEYGGKEIKQKFLDYDWTLLVADVRFKEQRKPNDSKARAKRQKSYR